ncbi:hypothetical protein PQR02_27320 [Paraburkholderia sediminicola]|uniref:hypothetical protein n=1 Tax=Paraburkholderia sediminicola TaxID=458836 RepID=UPI0038B80DA8
MKEQAIQGRIFKNLADVRAAAIAFKDRYNRDWRLEKLGFKSPLQARQERLTKRPELQKRVQTTGAGTSVKQHAVEDNCRCPWCRRHGVQAIVLMKPEHRAAKMASKQPSTCQRRNAR